MGGDPTRFAIIKGQRHKLCSGPAHDEPTWLPATDKYYYRHGPNHSTAAGRLFSQCRLCNNWKKVRSPGEAGWVPLDAALPFFTEAVRRVGLMETARRMDVSSTTVSLIVRRKRRYVQKRTLRKLMLELISMRRKNEVWHRDSIKHGSHLRGHKIKQPVDRKDFYHPHGDDDNERRRLWSHAHPDEARAQWRRGADKRRSASM
jgi:hypothetical protein